ncbi:unnamed protein product [Oppiella nova]|uniref:Uncharacterized protein n=1 Tax=Oppiella nova TaxID=334625 RepID=A0A7R9LTS5_9ACAR|nr:unnamed protein product [Oppiella nova]CAG2166884.1 unnamed protein product [Oppiella nova]
MLLIDCLTYNHSFDVHFKSAPAGGTGAFHQHSVDRKPTIKRKQGLNLFERLRQGKQDKIAANVQQHIRAIRAAEALDRQTGAHRRKNSSKLVPQRSTSSGDDEGAARGRTPVRCVWWRCSGRPTARTSSGCPALSSSPSRLK